MHVYISEGVCVCGGGGGASVDSVIKRVWTDFNGKKLGTVPEQNLEPLFFVYFAAIPLIFSA